MNTKEYQKKQKIFQTQKLSYNLTQQQEDRNLQLLKEPLSSMDLQSYQDLIIKNLIKEHTHQKNVS